MWNVESRSSRTNPIQSIFASKDPLPLYYFPPSLSLSLSLSPSFSLSPSLSLFLLSSPCSPPRYSSHKFSKLLRSLTKAPISKVKLHFCDEETSLALTGFGHNGVCPIGMKTPIPVVLSEKILEWERFWLGGGHVDLKLNLIVRVSTSTHFSTPSPSFITT